MRQSGIYKISHVESGNCYIGSSRNIFQRFKDHKMYLNKQKHHSVYLQRSWSKYGGHGFVFEILETCEESLLLLREQVWLDKSWPTGFNVNPIADKPPVQYNYDWNPWPKGKKRPPMTDEHRENISKSKKGKKLNMTPEQIQAVRKKAWESRRANGKGKGGYTHTKKRSKESYAQTWESRRKNGTDKASAETKKKLSDYNKKYRTGVNHPRYGTVYPPNPHSPETIQKITLTKRHKAMNQKQVKLYKTLYPHSYGDLLNIVNY